ncbi:hypothetical protein HU200_028933 [Digitaria exilis]|uniref:Sugar phosphate transporter domain-containing protein n=1 Tax=Digitaria exilis TaxID=1010633 RepID=A0A835BTY8_9POAL|nr:hypothetical protein HU200_028933 [Digitaria exilis]
MAKLQLGALFGLWHLFNTVRWKKVQMNTSVFLHAWQVLKVFPFPMNVTTVQFAVGTAVALLMWTTGILKRPKVSGAQVNIYFLSFFHFPCCLLLGLYGVLFKEQPSSRVMY